MKTIPDFVTVYFVRHGETVGNLKRVILPPTEDLLSDEGKRQAKLLGEYLRSNGQVFTTAFSSTYDRCLQTTEILLRETNSDEANVREDSRIREVNMGKYEGGSFVPMLNDLFSSGLDDLLDWAAEEGETRSQRRERIFGFLKDLQAHIDNEAASQDTILVTSHGACLYQMYQEMLKSPDQFDFLNWLPQYNLLQKNTGFFKIKIEKNPKVGAARKLDVEVGLGADHLNTTKNDTIFKFSQTPDGKTLKGCIQQ